MSERDVPGWLTRPQNYSPMRGNDRFLDQSILALSVLLAKACASRSCHSDRTPVLPELRLLSLVLLVFLVSLSRGTTFVSAVLVLLVLLLSFLDGEDIVRTLKASAAASLFSFLILLPSAYWSGFSHCIIITLKILATVTAVNIVSCTSRWDTLSRSIRIFPVPDIFILVLDVSLRYIALLGELSLEMFRAVRLRSVGVNRDTRGAFAGIAGSVFIASRVMAEELYAAMACRGFTGKYRMRRWSTPSVWDAVFVLANAGLVWFFIFYGGVL